MNKPLWWWWESGDYGTHQSSPLQQHNYLVSTLECIYIFLQKNFTSYSIAISLPSVHMLHSEKWCIRLPQYTFLIHYAQKHLCLLKLCLSVQSFVPDGCDTMMISNKHKHRHFVLTAQKCEKSWMKQSRVVCYHYFGLLHAKQNTASCYCSTCIRKFHQIVFCLCNFICKLAFVLNWLQRNHYRYSYIPVIAYTAVKSRQFYKWNTTNILRTFILLIGNYWMLTHLKPMFAQCSTQLRWLYGLWQKYKPYTIA